MSIEQVLLIVALLVLPLIQALLRAARKRHGDEPAQAERLPPPVHRAPMREPQPPPATEDRTPYEARLRPSAGRREMRTDPWRRRFTEARGGARQRWAFSPRELRRAIVLMTVLEPCRAIHPHD